MNETKHLVLEKIQLDTLIKSIDHAITELDGFNKKSISLCYDKSNIKDVQKKEIMQFYEWDGDYSQWFTDIGANNQNKEYWLYGLQIKVLLKMNDALEFFGEFIKQFIKLQGNDDYYFAITG